MAPRTDRQMTHKIKAYKHTYLYLLINRKPCVNTRFVFSLERSEVANFVKPWSLERTEHIGNNSTHRKNEKYVYKHIF